MSIPPCWPCRDQLPSPGPPRRLASRPTARSPSWPSPATSTNSANLTAFTTCYNPRHRQSNQIAATLTLPANPLLMKVMPGVHIDGTDSFGNLIPDGIHVFVLDATGFDIITSTISPPVAGTLCPQMLATFSPLQRIELGQGTMQPVNFFASADGSQLYIAAASTASILVYDFNTGTLDRHRTRWKCHSHRRRHVRRRRHDRGCGQRWHAAPDHHRSRRQRRVQLTFPSLPNYLNPFCTYTPTQGPCTLNTVLVRP